MICPKIDEGKVIGLNYFDIVAWLACPYDTIDENRKYDGVTASIEPIPAGDHGPYKVLKTPEGKFLGSYEYYFDNEEEVIEYYKEEYKY